MTRITLLAGLAPLSPIIFHSCIFIHFTKSERVYSFHILSYYFYVFLDYRFCYRLSSLSSSRPISIYPPSTPPFSLCFNNSLSRSRLVPRSYFPPRLYYKSIYPFLSLQHVTLTTRCLTSLVGSAMAWWGGGWWFGGRGSKGLAARGSSLPTSHAIWLLSFECKL